VFWVTQVGHVSRSSASCGGGVPSLSPRKPHVGEHLCAWSCCSHMSVWILPAAQAAKLSSLPSYGETPLHAVC
jgi:hypothetical protein